jgi:hypothetical protein
VQLDNNASRVQQIFFPGDLDLLFVNPPDSVISLSLLRTFGFPPSSLSGLATQRSSDESGKPRFAAQASQEYYFDSC